MNSHAAIALDRVTKVYDEPRRPTSHWRCRRKLRYAAGSSGSGKTMILQMIGGFLQPTAGRILFGGADMTALPPNKRPCNTIFQDLGLFPHMTVAETSAMASRCAALTRPRGAGAPLRCSISSPWRATSGAAYTSFRDSVNAGAGARAGARTRRSFARRAIDGTR